MRKTTWTLAVAAAVVAMVGVVGLAWAQDAKPAANPVVVMKTTMGVIKIELWPDKAPETVKNFLALVDQKFYDGTLIHRSWTNRIVQGGQYTKEWQRKEAPAAIKNEAKSSVSNQRGTFAMANRNEQLDSAKNQFIINLADNSGADRKDDTDKGQGTGTCVFGKIIEGQDIADKMGQVETETTQGHREVPKVPIVIESLTRDAAK